MSDKNRSLRKGDVEIELSDEPAKKIVIKEPVKNNPENTIKTN